jgi:heterodisulfide reductase subunit A
VGDFKVTLNKKPRYINEEQCTGCTICVEYCPVLCPDPFNQGISMNKAIHIYYSQAVPLITYIDEKNCLYLQEEKCRICEAVCQNDAIDFNQTNEIEEIKVGAIVLATGFEPFNPESTKNYGYGRFENVITSMDYERLMSSSGPYEGEILRRSDLEHPKNIAWIQCVGSRNTNPQQPGNSYCSAVCCTYTQKQVMLTKDHNPGASCTVFHNDIRSFGKDFESFYGRTESLPDVRFIRSYVSVVKEDPETKNVTIRYATNDEGVKEEEFEMVVLSVGLNPPVDYKGLAQKFGIALNSHGFCEIDPVNPLRSSRPGVFVSGAFLGPMDIPEAVVSASGAGSQCGELLGFRRGDLAVEKIYPPEKDVSHEEPRIGVFVCHCGANISRVVDVPSTVEYVSTLPYVVHAQEQLFACATNSADEMAKMIKEKGLNRVVVAACTPRTHEPTFRETLKEAGLNQYYFEMANIREHCSWVHPLEKEAATAKAKDLIRMSVARVTRLEALQDFELPVNKAALVVGGGLAGMTTAHSIADQGHVVYLIEKEDELGGIARRLYHTLEDLDVQAYLKDLIQKTYQHLLIYVYTGATIEDVSGYVGNFVTRINLGRTVKEIKHGAAVIATGVEVSEPTEYLYGENDRVMTHLDLEELIAKGDERVTEAESIVMIQCVGCRNEDRNYCSRICCNESIKNALKLREINPEMDIYIIFRDIRTYGLNEDYYQEAASKNIRFIRYEPENNPEVEAVEEDGREFLRVTVPDYVLGMKLELDVDLVTLAAAVIPCKDANELAGFFKVGLSPDGFFKEAHAKLRPVDFGTAGTYLCGMAHYPKLITETISQAYGAAGRVLTLLSHDTVVASGSVCEVDENKCISCGACIAACNYDAISFVETPKGRKASVNPVLCKGDGLCNRKCPTGAIQLKHFTDEEIMSVVDAAFSEKKKADAVAQNV